MIPTLCTISQDLTPCVGTGHAQHTESLRVGTLPLSIFSTSDMRVTNDFTGSNPTCFSFVKSCLIHQAIPILLPHHFLLSMIFVSREGVRVMLLKQSLISLHSLSLENIPIISLIGLILIQSMHLAPTGSLLRAPLLR